MVKGSGDGNKKMFDPKLKMKTFTNFVLKNLKNKKRRRRWRNRGFSNFMYAIDRVLSYIKTLVGHVMCLKQCITAFAAFANATSTTNTFDNVLSIGNYKHDLSNQEYSASN